MSDNTYRLQMQNGPEPGRSYELRGDSLTIGRYPLADIVIDDPDVSYRHALLTRHGSTYRIADLGSDAGTYVNGRRVGPEPVALGPGDVVLLGARLSAAFLPVGPVIIDQPSAPDEYEAPPVEPPVEAEPSELPGAAVYTQPIDTPAPAPPIAVARPPIHPEPLPEMPPPPPKKNNRLAWITAGCLLILLACCCATSLFMYFIGGDWLLNLLRSLP